MKRILIIFQLVAISLSAWTQGVKPLPTLHTEGRYLCDSHGNHVVLHGVMDTPNAWFNHGRWGWSYDSTLPCINYFEKLFAALEQSKCNVFRLHLDPVWTNDPSKTYVYSGSVGQSADASGEANISKFNPERLKSYLVDLYFPLAKRAMNHGMYVVVRPPGVCPGSLQVGDYYNQYLMTVWDLFTQNDSIKKYAGQMSIELANEPVKLLNAEGKEDAKAMHDFFQPIVDKIRANGFTGIVWVPGTGWQSNYTGYVTYPIESYNIGYAVHDYCGWYGCSDDTADSQKKIGQFHKQVPVVDTAPVIITEVDWSPYKPGTNHVNEHGETVLSNYGTWATGSTSKWGKAYKDMLDHYGNISMTLSGTACLIDIDTLLEKNKVVPAFEGLEEACGKACMDWYAEYYKVDWAHADFKNVSLSEQDNGCFKNPVVFADFPDPDVIRVGDTFYMISTTMHHFPGATILKSKDLVNWEYCAQPLTQLSTTDRYNLLNGQNAYADGMWACSMKYHNGKFYILINGNDAGGFVLSATDPEGKWEKKQLPRRYYDPGMLFDNGKVYVACGIGNIQMCELDEDFNLIQKETVISDHSGLEGCHLYKIGDYYYIYATYGGWPSGQTVFRSKNIFGPYEEKMLVEKTINGKVNTVHQGALFDTQTGEWWTIMQEDKGAMGRMPNLQPVRWQDDWPVVGDNGVPLTVCQKPNVGNSFPRVPLPTTDNFRSYPLGMQWQWNHNPDDGAWSLFERPGWLRMKAASNTTLLTQARNMLTQRIYAFHDNPSTPSIGTVCIDVSHLKEGDRAGICILQDPYAAIAVEVKDGQYRLVWWQDQLATNNNFTPMVETLPLNTDGIIYLRAAITYGTSKTQFYYSTDNVNYIPLGGQTTLGFNLSIFVGARFGVFCYNNDEKYDVNGEKGYADFDWFTTEGSFNEADYYPAKFEGYNADMLTAEELQLSGKQIEAMIGNNTPLPLIATYRDGHTADVAAQARFTSSAEQVATVQNGLLRALSEGTADVTATYTDPMGNELVTTFHVRSSFFPFDQQYINTSLFSQGTYTEDTRTFNPGQYGQMGWEYQNGADMSGYKYLVIKLKSPAKNAHLNIFSAPSIWSDCCSTPNFGTDTQIVFNLQTAEYTSGDKKGQKLDTQNIRIVSFWSNFGTIAIDDMYLTNNEDYTPNNSNGNVATSIEDVQRSVRNVQAPIYDLQGRKVHASAAKKGIYIVNGKKVVVR